MCRVVPWSDPVSTREEIALSEVALPSGAIRSPTSSLSLSCMIRTTCKTYPTMLHVAAAEATGFDTVLAATPDG